METSIFKRNVFKTLSVKPAKAGLRHVAKNTARTHLAHACVGVAAEVGELLQAVQPYLLGFQINDEIKKAAFDEMGDVGYYLTVGGKILKCKIPGSGKKVKLPKGVTRSMALMQLQSLATDILGQFQKQFYKGVVMPTINKDFTAEQYVQAQQAAKAEQDKMDAARAAILKDLFQQAINLYWALCYDMFGDAPAKVFIGVITKLSVRYPDGTFCMNAHEAREKAKEQKAALDAAAAA